MPARLPLDGAGAWQALTPLCSPGHYLPWSTGAMRPAGLVTLLNDVWLRTPSLIVELGSGLSTILIARLLRQLGQGRLLAVEHDEVWAIRIQRQLDREGLADVADVVRAPLRPHVRSWGGSEWYDDHAIVAAVDRSLIDLLVVDGPPAWQLGSERARYPALGSLASSLAAGATVVLDDVERAGEQDVIARWEREHGLVFDVRTDAGVAIATWPGAGQ